MAYSKQTWTDGADGGTPVSAARLTHLEDGIGDLDAGLVERVQDVLGAALVAGTNISSITYDDTAGTVSINAATQAGGGGGLTTEQVQDLVATMIVAGTNVTATYDDTAGTLTLAAAGGGGGGSVADTGLRDVRDAWIDTANAGAVDDGKPNHFYASRFGPMVTLHWDCAFNGARTLTIPLGWRPATSVGIGAAKPTADYVDAAILVNADGTGSTFGPNRRIGTLTYRAAPADSTSNPTPGTAVS